MKPIHTSKKFMPTSRLVFHFNIYDRKTFHGAYVMSVKSKGYVFSIKDIWK